jgi:hypothetical protein
MTKIPTTAKRIKNRPLALGEVTGHHHSIVADPCAVEMYEDADGNVFVHQVNEAPLTHQEHKPRNVVGGTEWGIRIANEVTDWGKQPVRD